MENTKLKHPSLEFNEQFCSMIEMLLTETDLKVVSNILNCYSKATLSNVEQCERFRIKIGRMNNENQSCFLDVISEADNELIGCCGFIKVNRILREAHFVFVFYRKEIERIFEATRRILKWAPNTKYGLNYLLCNVAGNYVNQEVISMLQALSFFDITQEKEPNSRSAFWLCYKTAPDRKGLSYDVPNASRYTQIGIHICNLVMLI